MNDPIRTEETRTAAYGSDPQGARANRPGSASPSSWDAGDFAPEEPSGTVRPLAALVSFHFLRAAVRRRMGLCLLAAVVGMLLGGLFLAIAPATHTATAALVLAHDPQVDPSRAMATDVGLLGTRTVAERAILELGVPLDPDDLLESLSATPPTSDILELSMTAPSDAEAVTRLDAFTKAYLELRATQVSAQSDAMLKGYAERIDALQSQVDELSTRIATLSKGGVATQDRLGETISRRSQLQNQISSVQETAQDVTLRRTALMAASRIIDPATVKPASGLRHLVLVLASGMIGGTALGVGGVLLHAILSDRLRLRVEVAAALGVPVIASVGRLKPLPRLARLLRFLPRFSSLNSRYEADLQRVSHAIERALPEPGHRQRLAVACVENSDEVRTAVAAAAVSLQKRGRTVALVDLSEAGRLTQTVRRLAGPDSEDRPTVHRPTVIPSLTSGPADLEESADEALSLGDIGVCLVFADVDPGVGVDHLTAWTDRVLVAVTAGRSSVDRIRTTGDLIRAAGLSFSGAVLIRALLDDASSGLRPPATDTSTDSATQVLADPTRASTPEPLPS